MMPQERFKLLIIEDDELDLEKIQRAMKRLGKDTELLHACDGIAGLELLRGNDETPGLREPLLVLLDLNMPRMNGHEFLAEVRADKKLRRLPIFVMSTSDRPQDINQAYDHNVNGFLIKPFTMQQTYDLMETLFNYWGIMRYPSLN